MGLTEREQEKLNSLAKKAGIKLPKIQGYQKLDKRQIHKLDNRFKEADGTPIVIIKKNSDMRIYTVETYLHTTDPSHLMAARKARENNNDIRTSK